MSGLLLTMLCASLVGFVFGVMFAHDYEITPRYSQAPISCTTDAECAELNPQYCGGPYEPECPRIQEAVEVLRLHDVYFDGDSYYKGNLKN